MNVYKEFKHEMLERGCKVESYKTATLDARPEKLRYYEWVDITSLVLFAPGPLCRIADSALFQGVIELMTEDKRYCFLL